MNCNILARSAGAVEAVQTIFWVHSVFPTFTGEVCQCTFQPSRYPSTGWRCHSAGTGTGRGARQYYLYDLCRISADLLAWLKRVWEHNSAVIVEPKSFYAWGLCPAQRIDEIQVQPLQEDMSAECHACVYHTHNGATLSRYASEGWCTKSGQYGEGTLP